MSTIPTNHRNTELEVKCMVRLVLRIRHNWYNLRAFPHTQTILEIQCKMRSNVDGTEEEGILDKSIYHVPPKSLNVLRYCIGAGNFKRKTSFHPEDVSKHRLVAGVFGVETCLFPDKSVSCKPKNIEVIVVFFLSLVPHQPNDSNDVYIVSLRLPLQSSKCDWPWDIYEHDDITRR